MSETLFLQQVQLKLKSIIIIFLKQNYFCLIQTYQRVKLYLSNKSNLNSNSNINNLSPNLRG